MDLWDVAKVMWRRRGVTLPLLLLSAIAAAFALLTIPPDYSGKAQLAFLPPASTATAGGAGNLFTVGTLAEFISISLNSPEVRQQMTRDGLSADYEVTFEPENLAVMGFSAVDRSQQVVARTIDRLVQLVQAEIVKLQSQLPPEQAITISLVDRGEIKLVRDAGMRALTVIAGMGLVVTSAIALIVDALIRRRSGPTMTRPVPAAAPLAGAAASATESARLAAGVASRAGTAPAGTEAARLAAAGEPAARGAASLAGAAATGTAAARLDKVAALAGAAASATGAARLDKAAPTAAGSTSEGDGSAAEASGGKAAARVARGAAPVAKAAATEVATADAAEVASPPEGSPADPGKEVTVLLGEVSDSSDNDVTIVLPLAGVSRSSGKPPGQRPQAGKRKSGDAPSGAKSR